MNNRENRNELRKKIQNYSYGLNDHLDIGHKGNIYKGVNQQSEDRVAIKVIDLRNKQSDHLKQQLGTQIEILKMSKHPNIVRCLDVYSTVNNCYIITQFCDQGDLQNRIHSRGGVKESQALIYFKDIINGFLYLSQERFVHGNLKLSSLLIKDRIVKISGFSNTRKVNKDEKDAKKEVPFNPYQSPQSVKENIFNFKSDIWSLGMILYVMLHGTFPWEYTNKAQFLQKIGRPFSIKNQLSDDVKQFLKSTLVNKQLRMGLQQLVNCFLVKKIALNSSPIKYPQANNNSPIIFDKIHKKSSNHFNLNKVQKQLNTQINWMRFLLRLIDRITGYPEQSNTVALKFIIIRQMAIQYQQLKCTLQKGENPFRLDYWSQFSTNRQKISKLKDIVNKYQPRYDKALLDYKKHTEKLKQIKVGFLNSLLNQNFIISQFNSVASLKVSLEEIKKLWGRIVKQYPIKQAYEKNTPFRYKAQLLLLDFLITYYQLNNFLVEDFYRRQHFQKNGKLQQILEYQPVELDATNLVDLEAKLKLLEII